MITGKYISVYGNFNHFVQTGNNLDVSALMKTKTFWVSAMLKIPVLIKGTR